jgi:hypothetical protein
MLSATLTKVFINLEARTISPICKMRDRSLQKAEIVPCFLKIRISRYKLMQTNNNVQKLKFLKLEIESKVEQQLKEQEMMRRSRWLHNPRILLLKHR